MKLKGSCHCGAVKFTLDSHTPQPFMRCYCSICRKTAGGGGYAINIMGEAASLKVTGSKNVSVYRAQHQGQGVEARHTVTSAPPLLLQVRQRIVGLGSAVAGMGLPVCIGHRHPVAETCA